MSRASSNIPGPVAVQATATCVETIIQKKRYIAINLVNKACLTGPRMRGNRQKIITGHGNIMSYDGCTATQPGGSAI